MLLLYAQSTDTKFLPETCLVYHNFSESNIPGK